MMARALSAALAFAAVAAWSAPASAHCDTLDGPVVLAARKALDTGNVNLVLMAKKKYQPNDVEADRAHASAYVEFVHYAERLYDAAQIMAPEHAVQKPGPAHTH